MALNNRDLQLIKRQNDAQFEAESEVRRGEVVAVNGSIVGTLPNTIWVRPLDENASPRQVFNPGTILNLEAGATVYYRQSPKPPAPWELINFDSSIYAPAAEQYQSLWQSNVSPHGASHELKAGYPGPDPLNVHPHAVVDLSCRPTVPASMKVRIYGGWYAGVDGNYAFLSGPFNSADLTASIPGSTGYSKIIAFVLDRSTGVVSTVAGSNYVEGTTPSYPTVTTDYILLSAVRLTNGMTAIENRNFDREMRAIVGNTGAGFNSLQVNKLVSPDQTLDPVFSVDNNGESTAINGVSANSFAFVVKNTSGGAAAANDVGYIDEAGEYKTTTTANDAISWCVVIQGGANNADIYVAVRGRVTVAYTGSAPSAGDYLVTSTTAGDAQSVSDFRPEVFAVCLAAGSGGTVEVLLLTQTIVRPITFSANIYQTDVSGGVSTSDWNGTIATLPGGADLTYTTGSGTEDNLEPQSTNHLAKIRLYNSTRGTYGLILDVDQGTNTITLTDSVPGDWMVGDSITIRSQVNTSTFGSPSARFLDFEITSSINPLTRAVNCFLAIIDTGAASEATRTHPWESNDNSKRFGVLTQAANVEFFGMTTIPIISNRFCMGWHCSGAGTGRTKLQVQQLLVAAP